MKNFAKILFFLAGIISLVFAVATGIIMLARGREINLGIVLAACVIIFIVASIACCFIKTEKPQNNGDSKEIADILKDAYEAIFKNNK